MKTNAGGLGKVGALKCLKQKELRGPILQVIWYCPKKKFLCQAKIGNGYLNGKSIKVNQRFCLNQN